MCVSNSNPFWKTGECLEAPYRHSEFPFADEHEATRYLIIMTKNPKFKILTGEKAREMYDQKIDDFWGSSSKTTTKKKTTTPKTTTPKTTTKKKTTPSKPTSPAKKPATRKTIKGQKG